MKNPYRKRDAYAVRGWLVGTGVVLVMIQLVMLGILLNVMTTPGAVPGMGRMVLACLGLAVVLTGNGLGMYWVSTRWEWLWGAEWKVAVAAVGNVLFMCVYLVMAVLGYHLWDGLTDGVVLLVAGAAVAGEIGVTVAAMLRLREK